MECQMPVMEGYNTLQDSRTLSFADVLTLRLAAMTSNAFQNDFCGAMADGIKVCIARPIGFIGHYPVLTSRLQS